MKNDTTVSEFTKIHALFWIRKICKKSPNVRRKYKMQKNVFKLKNQDIESVHILVLMSLLLS